MPRRSLTPWLSLAALATLPRLAGAMVRPPWHDEYFTVWVSSLPWSHMLAALRVDSGPPLLYVLARLLALTGLPLLAAARGVSVVAGVAATLVGARAARRTFGAEAGWWTGVLLALHPLAVGWSSEGRAYPLVLLAAALAWDRLAAIRDGERGIAGLAAAIALGCWSHALGIVLAAAVTAAALLLPPQPRRRSLAAAGLGLLAFLPWIPIAAAQPADATAWMAAVWKGMPVWERLAAPLRLLPPAAPFAATLDLPSPPPLVQAAAALGCLVLLVGTRPHTTPALLFAAPATALVVAAFLGAPVFYPGRSEAVYVLPFLGLVAAGVRGMRWRRAVAMGLVVTGAGVTLAALAAWHGAPPSREERVAAEIRASLPGGGVVVVEGYWWLELWYQLQRTSPRYRVEGFPHTIERHPGWQQPAPRAPGEDALAALVAELREWRGRAAVVATPETAEGRTLLEVARRFGLVPRLRVIGGELLLPSSREGDA